MARSAYIYLVMEEFLDEDGERRNRPVAPFTVKHELVSWLRRQSPERAEDLFVLRGRDNPRDDDEFTDLGIRDLLS